MANTENRKKLSTALMDFMAGNIMAEEFRFRAFECHDESDPTLLEISYKIMGDSRTIIDHYITIIKEDWHYYVQMATFLQTDRELDMFHVYDPRPKLVKNLSVAIFGALIPLGLAVLFCMMHPGTWGLLFIAVILVIPWSMLLAKQFNRNSNYEPDVELPHYWPYDSKEEFEEDFAKYAAGLDIPQAPPSLKGKVEDYSRKNLLWNSPRPDE